MRMSNMGRLTAGLLAVSVLFVSQGTLVFAAPQAQETRAARGLFGEVVRVESETIVVRTADGAEGSDTEFRSPRSGAGDEVTPTAGDRVAVVTADDGVTARSIMLLTKQVRAKAEVINHLSGVVIERDDGTLVLTTEDGREIELAFGLGGVTVEVGASVTLAGIVDPETGVVRVRSAQAIGKVIERLRSNIENIESSVVEREDQLQHVARIRELTEKISGQQIRLLERVQENHADQSVVLERALKNLQEAERNVERATERVIEIRGKQERESERFESGSVRALPEGLKPTLDDIAQALGLTQEELLAILRRGLSVAEAAEERGVTIGEVEDRVLTRIKTRIQKLVEAREVETETVDLLLSTIRESLASLIKRVFNDGEVNADLPISVQDFADALGVKSTKVFALLREGKTPREIAADADIDEDSFVSKVVEKTRERAQTLAENGTLDASDVDGAVDRFRAKLEGEIDKVQSRRGAAKDDNGAVSRPIDGLDLSLDRELIARILGLTIDELLGLLKEGVTLQEIAKRQGVDVQQVIEKLLAPIQERIIQMLRNFRGDQSSAVTATRVRPADSGERPLYSGIQISAKDVADAIGIPVDELQRRMSVSGGVAELLKERGLSAEELVAKLLRLLEERLTNRAAASDVAAEKVQRVLAETKRRLLNDLGEKPVVAERRIEKRESTTQGSVIPFDISRVAKALGIEPARLRNLLAEGLTVAEIADRSGVPLDQIVAALTETLERQIREAISSGRATEEEMKRKVEATRAELLRTLSGFKLGEKASERLTDATRGPDALLTDEERQKRIGAMRTRADAARRATATTGATRANIEEYRAALAKLESERPNLTREQFALRRAELAKRFGVEAEQSAVGQSSRDNAEATLTFAEEERKLLARRRELTVEEFNLRLQELRKRYGAAATDAVDPTPTPTGTLSTSGEDSVRTVR